MDTISAAIETVSEVLARIPGLRYWIALLIAVTAGALARLADRLLSAVFLRFVRHTKTEVDDLILDRLHHPLIRSTMLVGFYLAVVLVELPPRFESLGINVIQSLALLTWIFALVPLAGELVAWMSAHPERFRAVQPASQPLFSILSNVVLIGVATYIGLALWNIDVAGWAASVGIAGIAVGFAARDTLANLFAGVSILADAPYRIGDYIVLTDRSGLRGEVTHIGLRSTRILTRDEIEITIPNATIANSTVINESGGPAVTQRVRLSVGVAYGSDVDQVRQVLMDVARAEPLVRPEPEPRVRFREFQDSGMRFELLGWIALAEERGRALDALHARIHEAFAEAGIRIPFPQRVVHLDAAAGTGSALTKR